MDRWPVCRSEEEYVAALRIDVDSDLHLLRSAVRSIKDERLKADAETARFKLYWAIEGGDLATAEKWLKALSVALELVPDSHEWSIDTARSVTDALDNIAEILAEARKSK